MSPAWREGFEAELARCAAERIGLSRLQLAADQLERLWACVSTQPSAASIALPQELGGGYLPWDALVEACTVRETYFFRHPEQLDLLRRHALPELRAQGTPLLRAWSAGCASGEEAYSLAMLFEEEGVLSSAHVLGTDVCRHALETATRASYREWALRGLTPDQLARHFERSGERQCVRDSIRRHVTFRALNLSDACYPNSAQGTAGLSLICCRNVLMFLELGKVKQIARRLFQALAPGGFLLTGPSDPPLSSLIDCDVLVTRAGLLYQRPRPARAATKSELLLPSLAPAPAREPEAPLAPLAWPLPAPSAPAEPEPAGLVEIVRGLWNAQGARAALARCDLELERARSALELHYLRALLLWELGQHHEAVAAMRNVLYLDGQKAVAHFGLGALYERTGEPRAAVRCYRNVLACCDGLPEDAALPLGDGICAAGLRAAARHSLSRLRAGQASA